MPFWADVASWHDYQGQAEGLCYGSSVECCAVLLLLVTSLLDKLHALWIRTKPQCQNRLFSEESSRFIR